MWPMQRASQVINSVRWLSGKSNTKQVLHSDAEDGGGYMKRRLQQLAEDAMPTSADPQAGHIEDALPYNKIELHTKLDKIAGDVSNFEFEHQHALGVTTLPSSASKHAREIAMAKPWTGTESVHDASLRMLNDSIKPLKSKRLKTRIHDAKEGALDYKLAKLSEKKTVEDDGWSEMYRERLLGPSMLLNDSFASVDNSIKSLADQKIMEAQRRGEFANIKRGEPLGKGYHDLENRFIDRTEYHLNSILKRQDALPPWIERQGGCDFEIKRFREELDSEWIKWAVNHVIEENRGCDYDEIVSKMKEYVENESSDVGGSKLRSSKWIETRKPFFESKIRSLNDTIRGYNLQAPLASQKLYLILDKELEKCYTRRAPHLVEALQRHLHGSEDKGKKSPSVVTTVGSLPQRDNVYQRESESLMSMVWNLFSRK